MFLKNSSALPRSSLTLEVGPGFVDVVELPACMEGYFLMVCWINSL